MLCVTALVDWSDALMSNQCIYNISLPPIHMLLLLHWLWSGSDENTQVYSFAGILTVASYIHKWRPHWELVRVSVASTWHMQNGMQMVWCRLTWSPWRWVMKILFSLPGLRLLLISCTWLPSPQSNIQQPTSTAHAKIWGTETCSGSVFKLIFCYLVVSKENIDGTCIYLYVILQ